MALRILLTGGAGFSGSHLADAIIDQTDWYLTVLDTLTYAGKLDNLSRMPEDRFSFVLHNFSRPISDTKLIEIGHVDLICHLGAHTHVRNSLIDPEPFIQSNIVGTYNMLEVARKLKPKKFLYVSTDEVFGASLVPHKEDDALNPSNPYSASKAAGEMLVRAYGASFDIPWLITRTTNIFGTRQHSEKFIPDTIQKIKNGQEVEIHAQGNGLIGSRQWIHASDQASAIIYLLQHGQIKETYHIAGERKTNLEISSALARQMGVYPPVCRLVLAHEIYPGHDYHYALDDSKIRNLGWKPKLTFEQGLALTI